jgi:hypothetical protein
MLSCIVGLFSLILMAISSKLRHIGKEGPLDKKIWSSMVATQTVTAWARLHLSAKTPQGVRVQQSQRRN